MKRLITFVLVLAMVLSMGVLSAFAATDNLSATGDKEIDVKAMYSDQVRVPAVYSVDLAWGAMELPTKDSVITEDITGNFDITSNQLDAGTVDGYATADNVVSTLTISGALDSARTDFIKVGTVTVTIQ